MIWHIFIMVGFIGATALEQLEFPIYSLWPGDAIWQYIYISIILILHLKNQKPISQRPMSWKYSIHDSNKIHANLHMKHLLCLIFSALRIAAPTIFQWLPQWGFVCHWNRPSSQVSVYLIEAFPFYCHTRMVVYTDVQTKAMRSGPRLNIKTVLSTYGDFHVKDKTAVRTSNL